MPESIYELEEQIDAWASYAGELEREVLSQRAELQTLERRVVQMTYEAGILYRELDPYGLRGE